MRSNPPEKAQAEVVVIEVKPITRLAIAAVMQRAQMDLQEIAKLSVEAGEVPPDGWTLDTAAMVWRRA